jgi:2-keto-3-deoxy-L-rhamnonate aldolase RhmA
MRTNPVRDKLRRGETALGIMAFEFFTPGLPQILAAAGAEFCIFDMEHSGVGIETIKQQIAASRGIGLVPMVRVPGSHYHLIAPVLDAGAMGIMVPMVETAEEAEKIAAWCRYRPSGVRGLAFNLAHDDYRGGDIEAKMAGANERTLVIALIETRAGIDNADAILAVPGIDVGWLGHFDLSNALGITGQFDHPDFNRAVDRFLAACAKQGKAPGFLAGSPAVADAWLKRGVRCLCYGTDVMVFQDALAAALTTLRDR